MVKLIKNNWHLIFILLAIFLVSYFNRWVFNYKFEAEYWENYYYESQWNVPNSKRVISDEGVYRYVGYRLVNGENPFNVDYWVPPLGKYWYGWTARYLGNPYLFSYFVYLLSIYFFWKLASLLDIKKRVKVIITLIFLSNPLIVEQISQTMLDLPMTLFFIVTIYFLIKTIKTNKYIYLMLSGISLGLMSGTKPPFFIPLIGLVCLMWLYVHKIKNWWHFIPAVIIGYLLSYTCYFIRHPNPIPFIRLHDKIIEFQKNNGGNMDLLNLYRYIFIDKYQGHWVGSKVIFPINWSPLLPVGLITLVYAIKKSFKNKLLLDNSFLLLILLLTYLGMLHLINFWPRYLVPAIPLFSLIIGKFFSRNSKLLLAVFMVSILYFLRFSYGNQQEIVDYFNEKKTGGFYKETYRTLVSKDRSAISESEWQKINGEEIQYSIKPLKENGQWRIKIIF